MNRLRVVITGEGIICAAGTSINECAERFSDGTSSLRVISDPRLRHGRGRYAGYVDYSRCRKLPASVPQSADPFIRLAFHAAAEAIESAGIAPEMFGERMGLVAATCSGPMQSIERRYEHEESGMDREHFFALHYFSSAKVLAHCFGIGGINLTVTTACSASTAAIGLGAALIRTGVVDIVLVGGADTFSATTQAGFDGLKATCEGKCAPFSKPVGLTLGEGAGYLVLERWQSAKQRGVSIRGEIAGFGLSNDAYHCSAPDPSGRGAARAMKMSIERAGIEPEDIHYINAHGTGTESNDRVESKAVRNVFGASAEKIPVSSTKGAVGHCLGAAGSIEVIASLACARRGVYPPTVNFAGPREGCSLDYIGESGRRWERDMPLMSNNFAFGGNNASVVMYCGERRTPLPAISSEKHDRVVISGIGLISSAGVGIEALQEAVKRGSGNFSGSLPGADVSMNVAEVAPFDTRTIDRRLDLRGMDKASQYGTVAARCALSDASFPDRPSMRGEIGTIFGQTHAPRWAEREHITGLLNNDFRINRVTAFPYVVPNSISGTVCRALMLGGFNTTVCSDFGSGLWSIGLGATAIESGLVSAVLCGGTDEFSAGRARDIERSGVLADAGLAAMGEGSAMVMLEQEEHALSRGKEPLACIRSIAYSTETSRAFGADATGPHLHDTVKRALDDAQISVSEIAVICSTPLCARERSVIAAFFADLKGRLCDTVPVIGFTESCYPLFNLAAALGAVDVEQMQSRKYILTLLGSVHGVNCAMVIQRYERGA
jgi:3-oxoacyl-[acyl-carrier-protein] synthase II